MSQQNVTNEQKPSPAACAAPSPWGRGQGEGEQGDQIMAEARRIFAADAEAARPYLDHGQTIPTWDGIAPHQQACYIRFAAKGMGFPIPAGLEAA